MHDWDAIKTEYITGHVSYRQLSKKYNISLSTVGVRAGREEWAEKRRLYRNKVATKSIEKASERESNRLANLMEATSRAIDVVVGSFADTEQFNRYLVERRERYTGAYIADEDSPPIDERTWTEEQVFKKTDTKALKEMTSVLKELTGLMRDFYNLPTPAQAEAQRIAAERLELDKRKADADKADDTIVVVLENSGDDAWNE